MLSHRNIIANVEAIGEALREHYGAMKSETFLSFLPLAHIYERTAGFYLPLRLGAAIAYCESLFTVAANLKEARPTLMMCVPRLYESLRDKIREGSKALPEKQKIEYSKALEMALKQGHLIGRTENAAALGFVEKFRSKFMTAWFTAKSRRSRRTLARFHLRRRTDAKRYRRVVLGLGITVLEGYWPHRNIAVVAVNRPGNIKLGTVGQPVSSVEVRIESDGEICVRGDSIARGYWEKPEQTPKASKTAGSTPAISARLKTTSSKSPDARRFARCWRTARKSRPHPLKCA
jgi:long-chain acyl-CoA synthetase